MTQANDRRHVPHAGASARATAVAHEALRRSPGRPLAPALRGEFESRFGHDFRSVRVHSDARAAAAAQVVHASAFTVGNDIAFSAGMDRADTSAGRELLAHELAHVVQQDPRRRAAPADRTASPDAEREANDAARAVTRGGAAGPLSSFSPGVQRQDPTEEQKKQWMGSDPDKYKLTLDPKLQADIMAMNLSSVLDPMTIKIAMLKLNLDSILAQPKPAWLTAPSAPQPAPLVTPGPGPDKPKAGDAGDVLSAVMAVPAVKTALDGLKNDAESKLKGDWKSMKPGDKALLITQSALITGTALTAIMANPQTRSGALGLIQGKSLPTGVPGLDFQFNITGPDKRVFFTLDVGSLLPASLGFGKKD